MKKRLSLALAAGALVAVMLPGVASAGGAPVGGCPDGWELGLLVYSVRPQIDVNGDVLLCCHGGNSLPAAFDNTPSDAAACGSPPPMEGAFE